MMGESSKPHRFAAVTPTVVHYTDASVIGDAEQMILSLLAELDPARLESDPVSPSGARSGGVVGGANEAVENGISGFLVPRADPAALVGAICRPLADRELAARLGTEGRERVQRHFSSALVAARTMGIYEELLDRGPAEAAGLMPSKAWPL